MQAKESDAILVEIQTTVKSMHRQLFGNGQPGVIAEMKGRIHALERMRWIVYGGLMVVAVVVGGIYGSDVVKLLAGR